MRLFSLFAFAAFLFASCATVGSPPASKFFLDPKVRSLAEAAASGDIAKLDRLVSAGVSVNAMGRGQVTSLMWALLHQNKKGLAFLLAHGADPNVQLTEDFDELLIEGVSTMSYAAQHKDSWYLKEVLSRGGNPNLVNSVRSQTPIMAAIGSMRPENVRILISAGANLDWQDRDGRTAMMAATTLNQYELICAMLEAGADPKLRKRWGTSIVSDIKVIRTDPKSEQWKWRAKVIERLIALGIDFEHER
ncbi:MAG: ankyrin repeat domain-containing protein [Opitutaceae bacterium]|nr:ankyrin repeat domain-containing protein [Opitutaceae bacterium]